LPSGVIRGCETTSIVGRLRVAHAFCLDHLMGLL
jgi:hypothetical protein